MLSIAFYTAKPTALYERVVDMVAGNPTHCELVFSDGRCSSSSNRDGGCRFKDIELDPAHWTLTPLEGLGVDEQKVRNFCIVQQGKGYDWIGVFLGLWSGADDPRRWFCSEVCTAALKAGGLDLGLEPVKTTPKRLMERICGVLIPAPA